MLALALSLFPQTAKFRKGQEVDLKGSIVNGNLFSIWFTKSNKKYMSIV